MSWSGLAEELPELEASLLEDLSPRNVMRVADASRLAGRSERAIELLEALVAERPTAIAPLVLLSWCQSELGREDEARATLEDVRALDPANPFGVWREAPPPEPEAEPESVEAAVVVTPDPEAEAEPERALTAEEMADIPPSPLYSATLAEIFERQGFEEKAMEIYSEVVRTHPERVDLRERIAELERRLPEEPQR